jgi:hypothetical protein
MGQIAFLTLYLGLVSGNQRVELRVDPEIAMVRMALDGKPVATLTQPPWRATVDFGSGLLPQQLVAIGYDKDGAEVSRVNQGINVPRPMVEADVVVHGQTVELTWRHRMNEKPFHAALRIDDKPVAMKDYRALLPQMDMTRPHVLEATLAFPNGSARVEREIGGLLPDSTGTELTPVAVRRLGEVPASLDGCFSADGTALKAREVEKTDALLILVRNPNPVASLIAMGKDPTARSALTTRSSLELGAVGAGTYVRILWPRAQNYSGTDLPTSQLFPSSGDFDGQSGGMLQHLFLEGEVRRGLMNEGRTMRLADATAVAGIQAADGGRRRAVVVVLDGAVDGSRYAPSAVRRYLTSIGVPLFVWSVIGPQRGLEAEWGRIIDVSHLDKLLRATEDVNRELDTQRIVWLDADPFRALRASVKPSCGLTMAAR